MKLIPILFAALAIPFAFAHYGDGNRGHSDGCPSNHFRWHAKNSCVEYGGPREVEQPPNGNRCPSNWSWRSEKGCCVPHQPPEQLPPPQCEIGWLWLFPIFSCRPDDTPTSTTPHSQPSSTPYSPGGGGHGGDDDGYGDHNPWWFGGGGDDDDDRDRGDDGWKHKKRAPILKRMPRSRSIRLCPQGLAACPMYGLTGDDYECVDTVFDLDNCGGCASSGEGLNCNVIVGAWNVGCEQGACKVYTCTEGYRLAADGRSCTRL